MKQSVRLAVIAVVVVSLWLLSGRFFKSSGQEQEDVADKEQVLMAVEVMESTAAPVSREIVLQGQLQADKQVVLRAETTGSVAKILVEEGAVVEADQLLLQLAEKDRLAQLNKADAEIANKELVLKAMRKLNSQGLQSDTNLKQAEAELSAAYAEKKRVRLDWQHTRIRAPFAGVLEKRLVNLGSYVEIGDQLVEIVDISKLKAVAYANQQQVGQLHLKQPVHIRLLGGHVLESSLDFISTDAESETRSFRVEAEFSNPDNHIVAGVSIEMHILAEQLQGHKLSTALLTLNDAGILGVKAVDAENKVVFYPTEKIKIDDDGIWVAGLPDNVRVISRGQNFVVAGETVRPMEQ